MSFSKENGSIPSNEDLVYICPVRKNQEQTLIILNTWSVVTQKIELWVPNNTRILFVFRRREALKDATAGAEFSFTRKF